MSAFLGVSRGTYRSRLVMSAALAALVLLTFAWMTGPVSRASANGAFCSGYLFPYGQAGDRCESGIGTAWHHWRIDNSTGERAGCVQALGYYGEAVSGWACAPPWSTASVYLPNDGGFYRGKIRNNNVSNGAYFNGWFWDY